MTNFQKHLEKRKIQCYNSTRSDLKMTRRRGDMREKTKNRGKKNRILKIVSISLSVLLALLVCLVVVKIFFVTNLTVDQTSMYPTYEDGETVFVNRLGKAERGAVAAFYDRDVAVPRLASAFPVFSGDALLLIKRVVGLAGDQIWLEETAGGYEINVLCAENGETVREEYYDGAGNKVDLAPITLDPDTAGVLYDATRWDPYVVGEGCVFMIGDNRPLSQDSRVFGDVPTSRIVGIAIN